MGRINKHRESDLDSLREAAELTLTRMCPELPSEAQIDPEPAAHAARLLHELRVHQVELEMQNEELRRAQRDLAAARARYFDLYDQAPAGYLTLDFSGVILEANLAASRLLGVTKAALRKKTFEAFTAPEDQALLIRLRANLARNKSADCCELRLITKDGKQTWVSLHAAASAAPSGIPLIRIMLIDRTAQKVAEAKTAQYLDELQSAHQTLSQNAQVLAETVEQVKVEKNQQRQPRGQRVLFWRR